MVYSAGSAHPANHRRPHPPRTPGGTCSALLAEEEIALLGRRSGPSKCFDINVRICPNKSILKTYGSLRNKKGDRMVSTISPRRVFRFGRTRALSARALKAISRLAPRPTKAVHAVHEI